MSLHFHNFLWIPSDHVATDTWEVATAIAAAESPVSAPFAHAPMDGGLGL